MNEKHEFKYGDQVRMMYQGEYHYGEVTVVKETECKVIFEKEYGPDYWYYPKSELELVKEARDGR